MLTPSEIILQKNLVSSKYGMSDEQLAKMTKSELDKLTELQKRGMDSAAWMKVKTGIKERAFWVSRVESVKFVETCSTKIAELLSNAKNKDGATTSRAEVVSEIMRSANAAGINTGSQSVRNPGSEARANIIIDTNAGLAAGYASAMQSNTYGARLAYPAQELIRIEDRNVERPWRKIWVDKGGHLVKGRMVALKDDQIWIRLSRFGHPHPPFDYNSGMGLDDISFDEAVSLGLITDDYKPSKDSPLKQFNAELKADLVYKNDSTWNALRQMFGDQIRFDKDEIKWRQDVVKDAFLKKRHFEIEVGQAPDAMKRMLPTEHLKELVGEKNFTLDSKWLRRKRKNGLDHYSHFVPLESDPRNTPLTADELELLPCIYREPDKIVPGKTRTSFINVMYDGSGGSYCLILDAKKDIRVKTFLKLKPGQRAEDLNNELED